MLKLLTLEIIQWIPRYSEKGTIVTMSLKKFFFTTKGEAFVCINSMRKQAGAELGQAQLPTGN